MKLAVGILMLQLLGSQLSKKLGVLAIFRQTDDRTDRPTSSVGGGALERMRMRMMSSEDAARFSWHATWRRRALPTSAGKGVGLAPMAWRIFLFSSKSDTNPWVGGGCSSRAMEPTRRSHARKLVSGSVIPHPCSLCVLIMSHIFFGLL